MFDVFYKPGFLTRSALAIAEKDNLALRRASECEPSLSMSQASHKGVDGNGFSRMVTFSFWSVDLGGEYVIRMARIVTLQQRKCPENRALSWWQICHRCPDSKVPGTNMGPIWGRQDPGGPHVDPRNLAIWVAAPHVVVILVSSVLLLKYCYCFLQD